MVVNRFEIWMTTLDPTQGSELQKTHPCLIVSPDAANRALNTVVALPLTSTLRSYPTRIDCTFKSKQGQVAVDQVRSLDKSRIVKKKGNLDETTAGKFAKRYRNYFAFA